MSSAFLRSPRGARRPARRTRPREEPSFGTDAERRPEHTNDESGSGGGGPDGVRRPVPTRTLGTQTMGARLFRMGDSGADTWAAQEAPAWATQEAPAPGAVVGADGGAVVGAVEGVRAPARSNLDVVESAISSLRRADDAAFTPDAITPDAFTRGQAAVQASNSSGGVNGSGGVNSSGGGEGGGSGGEGGGGGGGGGGRCARISPPSIDDLVGEMEVRAARVELEMRSPPACKCSLRRPALPHRCARRGSSSRCDLAPPCSRSPSR